MSDIVDAPKAKGGKGKLLLIIVLVLLMMGAGVAGGLYVTGAFGGDEEEAPKEDPNKPHLVLKGEDPEEVAAKYTPAKGEAEGESTPEKGKAFRIPKGGVDLPRPKKVSEYHATYFQLPTPFTSNMVDTDSFVQISVAVSTYYDMRVIEALKTHEMALRSAILLVLAQESEVELSTPAGKAALQKKLVHLINQVLKEKTGYGGVDNVYFTNFVIQ